MKKMMKMLLATALCTAIVATAAPTDVKAMYSCSQDIINAANAQIASTQAAYETAKANEAAALANFNAVRAAGGSELEVTVAGNAYTTAKAQTKWYLDQVNNAKAYLENITGRANLETAFQQEREVLGVLTKLQAAKTEYESAQALAVGAAEQIKSVQNAIAGYQQSVAAIPAFQAQIDALNAQLVALQADYNAKAAVAAAKKADYEAKLAAGGYNYSPTMENYWQKRDNARTHEQWCTCEFCRMANAPVWEKHEPEHVKEEGGFCSLTGK